MTDVADVLPAVEPKAPSQAALLVMIAGIFITTLDIFIVNVAIPSMQDELHAGPSAVQFVVAGYGLALAALLVTAGRLGDLYGRRRMFVLGLVLFGIASAACGLAPDTGTLLAARVVQGAAAAVLTPQATAIIKVSYQGPALIRAFRLYGLAIGCAAVFGQLIGGLLIKADLFGLGWRAVFLINIPVCAVAAVAAPRLLAESRGAGAARLDLVGTVLIAAGLTAIVLPLVQGRQQGWPLWTWLCLAAAVPLLAGFAMYQHRLTRRGGAPLMHLSLLRERAFGIGMPVTVLYQMTMASFFLVLALYLQEGRGLSALESGLIFVPLGAGYFLATAHAPRFAAKIGRHILTIGVLVLAAGYGLLALTVADLGLHGSVLWVIPAFLVAGYGMGLYMIPSMPLILAGVSPEHAAVATGALATAQQAGGSVGVAVIGVVFYNAAGGGIPHAFVCGSLLLVGLCAAAAAMIQAMPKS